MAKIETIGILTSGGDAPGMNAAIRAVTRAGICNGFHMKGIYRGYDGLINGEISDFSTENVSGIIMQGGTILKTARSKDFMTAEGKARAYEQMKQHKIDALVVIGGNGSLRVLCTLPVSTTSAVSACQAPSTTTFMVPTRPLATTPR